VSMNVVFSSAGLGGSDLFNLEFLRTVRRRGVHVNAVVPGLGPLLEPLEAIADRIEVVKVPEALTSMSRFEPRLGIATIPRRTRALGGYVRQLRGALDGSKAPMCALGFRSQLAMAVASPRQSRVVWVAHEIVPPGAPQSMWSLAARRTELILAYSQATASQDGLRGRNVRQSRVRFDLAPLAALPVVDRLRTIGLIGDLVDIKNHLTAIRILKEMRVLGQENMELLLVGRAMGTSVPRTMSYETEVRKLAQETGGVSLVSAQPSSMPAMMRRIDVLLHLTSVPESFGRVCVEAMAAGRPVVAFDHGAVHELIDHGSTGFLCPVHDVEAVLAALMALRRDAGLARAMGSAAREVALSRFAQSSERHDTIGDALAEFAVAPG
jgi:Glycosyl transferases group 1